MKCPYCEKEMEEGYILSARDPLYWYPKDEEITFGRETENCVKLAKYPSWNRRKTVAYKCGSCSKIIIDIPNL